MNRKRGILGVCLAGMLVLSGCTGPLHPGRGPVEPEASAPALSESSEMEPEPVVAEEVQEVPAAEPVEDRAPEGRYIDTLVQETLLQFTEPGMSEFERAKAAFDYMIESVTLVDPVGLELWRIRGDYDAPPSFVENRSLSVLLFRVGKCEDYAAALTMLLRGMGLEAEYVPGLTYSTQGALVDHAWTVAKIDGVWYHLDCQLEQNISRHGSIRYKYFLRGDATMSGSHRWGQNLIDSRLLSAAQNEEIVRDYLLEPCPQDYPTPSRHAFTAAESPDVAAIQAEIQAEFQEYERIHGPLEPVESNIVPPVFALEGYGPQD